MRSAKAARSTSLSSRKWATSVSIDGSVGMGPRYNGSGARGRGLGAGGIFLWRGVEISLEFAWNSLLVPEILKQRNGTNGPF